MLGTHNMTQPAAVRFLFRRARLQVLSLIAGAFVINVIFLSSQLGRQDARALSPSFLKKNGDETQFLATMADAHAGTGSTRTTFGSVRTRNQSRVSQPPQPPKPRTQQSTNARPSGMRRMSEPSCTPSTKGLPTISTISTVALALKTVTTETTHGMVQVPVLPEVVDSTSKRQSNPRFPPFASVAFNRTCPWAINTSQNPPSPNCTLFAEPTADDREGISSWIALVVSGYVMAKQAGCSLVINYAEGVNISDVFLPTGIMDWRMPPNFTCHEHCYRVEYAYPRGGGPDFRNSFRDHGFLAAVPPFRTPYLENVKNHESGLKRTLGPGFAIETTMACAMGTMFQLSPAVVQYQPNLFTTILPTLRDPQALVLALYIRTGHTEHLHIAERTEQYRAQALPIVTCALHLEQMERNRTTGSSATSGRASTSSAVRTSHPKVVWMLVTDSQYIKTWIQDTYSKTDSSASRRTILTTQSRGAHTKASAKPSTADFSEGFLDWYLIGESDYVISDHEGPSFGNTASFRTARPHFKVPKDTMTTQVLCRKVEPSLEYTGP